MQIPRLSNYDLLGFSPAGQLRLVVELKSRTHGQTIGLADAWLQQAGQQEPLLYALFITPEFMLLRLPAGQRMAKPQFVGPAQQKLMPQLQAQPMSQFDYAIDSTACLDAAIDTRRIPLNKLTAGGIERVVNSWLSFALLLPTAQLANQPAQAWLVASGLHEALANGKVELASRQPQTYGFAA